MGRLPKGIGDRVDSMVDLMAVLNSPEWDDCRKALVTAPHIKVGRYWVK